MSITAKQLEDTYWMLACCTLEKASRSQNNGRQADALSNSVCHLMGRDRPRQGEQHW